MTRHRFPLFILEFVTSRVAQRLPVDSLFFGHPRGGVRAAYRVDAACISWQADAVQAGPSFVNDFETCRRSG